jgi:hypothetical protein
MTIDASCHYSSLSRASIHRLARAGRLSIRKVGRRTLILRRDLSMCLSAPKPLRKRPDMPPAISIAQRAAHCRQGIDALAVELSVSPSPAERETPGSTSFVTLAIGASYGGGYPVWLVTSLQPTSTSGMRHAGNDSSSGYQ